MSVMTSRNVSTTYEAKNTSYKKVSKEEKGNQEAKKEVSKSEVIQTEAATYEKGKNETSSSVKKTDHETIEKMKADAEARTAQLRSLVEKMMVKQGQAFDEGTNIYELLREGKVEVDPEVAKQASEDIAEDGYWGVEKTSDRLLSFAKALSGNDPSKANLLIDAVRQGFEEATKTWGDELPDICKKTLETTIDKLEKWRGEITPKEEA